MALKWAVTEKFNDFPYYVPSFTIYSDCNPLTYKLYSAKLNATTIRWLGDLSRHPVDIISWMDQCNEETTDRIGAVVAGSKQEGKFAVVKPIMIPEFGKLATLQLSPDEVRAER